MLLNAVIIILREVLEASFIFSVLLAFSQRENINRLWITIALPVGILCATFYAINIATVSNWFDGAGQELMNALNHSLLYLTMVLFVCFTFHTTVKHYKKIMSVILFLIVVFASIREGSEIILYIDGFTSSPDLLKPVLLGSAIGAGIGGSIGVFFYYLLVSVPKQLSMKLGFLMCLLFAGAMILQVIQLLVQADYLPGQYPLWDISSWVSESSTVGQLLYALVGYESRPTPLQMIAYVIGLSVMSLLAYFSLLYSRQKS